MPLSPQRAEGDTLEAYLRSIRTTHEQMDSGMSWSGHERNCAFLNTGRNGRFANISAVSGLDFLDDARGVAYTDWDHDGDLDIWLSNRTSPRLRLMRNNCTSNRQSYIALRLQGNGLATNRDAIGARVTVELDDGTRLIRGLRAGEGFLSQSSKWLHIGLGDAGVKTVMVRWPGGEAEAFRGITSGNHYRLVQGTGRALKWTRPGGKAAPLAALPVETPPASDAARIVLSSRLPLPALTLRELESPEKSKPLTIARRPTLINFWASWCAPCQVELAAFAKRAKKIESAGIDIIALSTDGQAAGEKSTVNDAQRASSRLKLPFATALTTAQTLDKMNLINRFLFDRRLPFSLPVSYLIDADAQIAVVYRGPVSVETLLADVRNLNQPAGKRRDASVPLPGRWYTPPADVNPRAFAKWFEEPFPDEAARYLALNIHQQARHYASARPGTAVRERARFELVESHRRLAVIRSAQERHAEAADHCRAALELDPHDAHLRYLRITALTRAGSASELKNQLDSWLDEDPKDYQARLRLAELHQRQEDFTAAANQLEAAVDIVGDDVYGRMLFGLALAQNGVLDKAVTQFTRALELQPDHREAILNLAAANERLGQSAKAINFYEKAFALTPDSPFVTYKIARLSALGGDHLRAIEFYRKAISIRPDAALPHEELGLSLLAKGRDAEAIKYFLKAFDLDPRRAGAANNAAWILATHPDPKIRNGKAALALATRINTLTKHQESSFLDTLAAAHAERGEFDSAVDIAGKAIELATRKGEDKRAADIQLRLQQYRKKKPFRAARQDAR